MPIDPVKPVSSHDVSPMAPPYVDEDINITLVEQGMDVAESEMRDAVSDAYAESALVSDDPEESLDDIDYETTAESPLPAELAAIHEHPLSGGDEYEEEDFEKDEEE